MRRRIAIVGAPAAEHLRDGDFEVVDISAGMDEISGADVVVLAGDHDGVLDAIRDRAPNSVVIVVGASPQPACETTLFPRSRVIGIEGLGDLRAVVDSIVHDRGQTFSATARCEGERGIDGEFATVPVRIGERGVIEIVEG